MVYHLRSNISVMLCKVLINYKVTQHIEKMAHAEIEGKH